MNQTEFDKRVNKAGQDVLPTLPDPEVDIVDAITIANALKNKLGFCNCDLDNWVPSRVTGHSSVCAIHRLALRMSIPYDRKRAALAVERNARAEILLGGLHHD